MLPMNTGSIFYGEKYGEGARF